MARKGQFKKGGGRHGGASSSRRKSRRSSTTAIVVAAPRSVTRRRSRTVTHRRARSRRRGGRMGGVNLLHVGLATGALAFLTSAKSPTPMLTNVANKIPGAKTFGVPATIGLACLAVDRFVKPNKYLKLAGIAGVVLAAAKVGEQGTDFKFVGDGGDDDIADIGDDDVADYDDVGDDDD